MTSTESTAGADKRHIQTLVLGNVFAHAVSFLALPMLTRLYSPADFGVYAVFVAVVNVLAVAAAGRYDSAIVLPKEEPEARVLVTVAIAFVVVFSLLISLIVLLDSATNSALFGALAGFSILVPAAVFVSGLGSTQVNWLIREQAFRLVATARCVQSVGSAATKLLLVSALSGAGGLIMGSVLGPALGVVFAAIALKSNPRRWWHQRPALATLKATAVKHRKFPLYNAPGMCIGTVTTALPPFLFLILYGDDVAGQYALCYALLAAPLGVVSGAVSQVFYRRVSTITSSEERCTYLLTTLKRVMPLTALAIVAVSLSPAQWCTPLFGQGWTGSLAMARLLVWWYGAALLSGSVLQLLVRVGRQRTLFIFELIGLLVTPLAIWLGHVQAADYLLSSMYLSLIRVALCLLVLLAVIRAAKQVDAEQNEDSARD